MIKNFWKLFTGIIFLFILLFFAWTHKVPAQTWTDATLTGGEPIRTVHFRELRRAVFNKRVLCGMAPYPWTDPTIVHKTTPVRATHIDELRTAINQIYSGGTVPRPAPAYTDATLTAGATPIRATHISELRTAISSATCCGDGTCDMAWEDGTNCPVDCVCDYDAWQGDSTNCGDNLCEPTEIYQVRTSPDVGCPDLWRCVQDKVVCCAGTYGSWVYYDCGGGDCDPTAERFRRISTIADCEPEYQCGALESCCGWGTPVFTCGYGGYPPTTYVKVTTPTNPACTEDVVVVEEDSEFCCDYPVDWTDMGCGVTFEGTTYPVTTHLQVKVDNLGICDSKLDITENAIDLCCNYPVDWTDLGCGIIFEGVTYDVTTHVKVKVDADGNCDSQVETTPNALDVCCDYPAGWTDLGCGITFDGVNYGVTEHVEVKIDGNGVCDSQVQVTNDVDFCCDYPAAWNDLGCGATFDGTTYPDTTSLRIKADNNGVCDTLLDITPNDIACCDYPAGWTDLGCGATYAGTTYPANTRLEIQVDNNGVCPTHINVIPDPATCCDYNTIDGCGLEIDGFTYPPTTWVEAEVDSFAVCPSIILQEIPNANDLCCSFGAWSNLGCGVFYDGVQYPPTTLVRIRTDSWNNCAPEIDPIVDATGTCCDYPVDFVDQGCNVTFEGVTYPPTSRVRAKVDGFGSCPTIIQQIPDDPTCCDYPGSWTDLGCGVTYDGTTYAPTVHVLVKEDNNGICSPQIDATTDIAFCCNYPGSWTDLGCGVTYDGTTYPVTTRLEVKEDSNGNCAPQKQITPNDLANCCDYPGSWTDMGCGATFEGTTYPSTTHLQVKVDGNGVCDSQLDITNNATAICCAYPGSWTDMGCGATFMGTTYPVTTHLNVKIDSNGNCNPLLDIDNWAIDICCDYPADWTDMGCGATFEGTTYPVLTHLEVKVDGYGNCNSRTRVTNNDIARCCTYPVDYTGVGCGATYESYSCPEDEMLVIKFPTPVECPIQDVGCSTDVAWGCYMCTPEGRTFDCTPGGDPCPWVKTCTAGVWGACQQVSICTPGQSYDCPPNADGFVDHKICNDCGDGYSACFCDPQETQPCTTGSGCPGIGTCSGGVWTSCQQSNSLCIPGQQQSCGISGGPGYQVCSTCGDAWSACACNPGITVPCSTGGGCPGERSCNVSTGQWESCVQTPAAVCTPGEERSCGFLMKETCDSCGIWGDCQFFWL